MKIKIAIMLCILLLLSGCTRNLTINPQEDDDTITLKWMIYGNKTIESDKVFRLFNQKLNVFYPNIKVEFEVIPKEDYKDEWDMKMATNEEVDIAWIGEGILNYSSEVKKGSFMALDYLLLTYGSELIDNISGELWERQVREGNIFAIPLEGIMFKKQLALVTNEYYMEKYTEKDALQKLFLDSNYTSAQHYHALEQYLEYVKEYESMGTGVSYKSIRLLADKGMEGIYGTDSPFVYKIHEDQIVVYNKYALASYRDYFEAMDLWYKKGFIRSDINEIINPLKEDGKKNGSVLFVAEDQINNISNETINIEYEASFIRVDKNRYLPYDSCRNALVIPKSSNNPQQAMELINLINSEEGKGLYRLLVNGIEDEHYIVLENDTIARMRDNSNRLVYNLPPNCIGSTFQNYQLSKDQFYRTRIYNGDSIKSKLVGFDVDTRMIISELTKVEIVVEEYLDMLSQGNEEDWNKTYEEMLLNIEKAGSNKIIQELQHQINDFSIENK